MEVCCHGFRQGLSDSLYFFYCVAFGSCLNSSTSCNSWIRGHSLITLARFWPFLTTYLPRLDISSTTYLPTSSCQHSLWTLPQKEQILLKAISKNKWFFTFKDEDSDKDEKPFFFKKEGRFQMSLNFNSFVDGLFFFLFEQVRNRKYTLMWIDL